MIQKQLKVKMVKRIYPPKKIILKRKKLKSQYKKIHLEAQISILISNQIFNKPKIESVLHKLMSIKNRHKKNLILEHKIFLKI